MRIARYTFAKELRERGALALFADIPLELNLKGIDDVAGLAGPDKALEIINAAYDPKKKRKTEAQAAALTEERLAQQFEAQYEPILRYDHTRGSWFVWSLERGCWEHNRTRLAYHFARSVPRIKRQGCEGICPGASLRWGGTNLSELTRICGHAPTLGS